MNPSLCITFRYIQPVPLFHGRGDGDAPEWPPSPLRAFQALLNAASLRTRGKPLPADVRSALQVLERLRPSIVTPSAVPTMAGRRSYVPHNQADLVIAAWSRGDSQADIAEHRTAKDHRPHRIETSSEDLPALHYAYSLDGTNVDPNELLRALRPSVRSIHCLGWGIDQVIADVTLIDAAANQPPGERWTPTPRGGRRLRTPAGGSLDALSTRHDRFLGRLAQGAWTPVPPLTAMEYVRYRRDSDPIPRPVVVFKLLDDDDDTVSYAPARLIHLAGMIKHVTIEAMKRNPPPDLRGRPPAQWIASYVAGHRMPEVEPADAPHTQLSYIPLPSIGFHHTDPGVRRVMIAAPPGDDGWIDHIARQLDGTLLHPLPNTTLPPGTRLQRTDPRRKDGVRDAYLTPSASWASVTPVILPGHDDHKPEKTRRLIEKALSQSGIEQPCQFDWSAYSHFPKSFSAHKYDRDKRPMGYIRPDHLIDQSAVHLTLTFNNTLQVPGPLTIGAGRHCGFGLMAATET